jgi:hypothetical protein
MSITLEEYMEDFTPEERAMVAARAPVGAQQLRRRDGRQTAPCGRISQPPPGHRRAWRHYRSWAD